MKSWILVLLCLAVSMSYGEKVTEGFENDAVLKKMEIEGDVVIVADQFHGGKKALTVPEGAEATLPLSAENRYGVVSLWVYDSCTKNTEGKAPIGWNGPFFGLVNADGDKLALWAQSSKGVKGGIGYAVIFTADNQWFNRGWSKIQRKAPAWKKFTFDCSDEKTLTCTVDDSKEAAGISTKIEFFNKGFTGIVMGGGKAAKAAKGAKGKDKKEAKAEEGAAAEAAAGGEKIYFDDIEAEIKPAVKTPAK